MAVGVILPAVFVHVEGRVGDGALLPHRLFRRLPFAVVNVVNLLGEIGVFSGLVLIPLYLQLVKRYSPTAAGLLLLPAVRALGPDLRIWVAAYGVYLLAVLFPQSSLFRLLLPMLPTITSPVAMPMPTASAASLGSSRTAASTAR